MTSTDGPKTEATQATSAEAVVTLTIAERESGLGSTVTLQTVTITGTAEQVRTARQTMDAPAASQVQRSGVSVLV